jgi:tetratricopeptide (TPR) repeat protein
MDIKERVAKLKEEGNQAFFKERYNEAIEAYSKAILLEPQNAILYTNRASAYIKIKEYDKALEDAETVRRDTHATLSSHTPPIHHTHTHGTICFQLTSYILFSLCNVIYISCLYFAGFSLLFWVVGSFSGSEVEQSLSSQGYCSVPFE